MCSFTIGWQTGLLGLQAPSTPRLSFRFQHKFSYTSSLRRSQQRLLLSLRLILTALTLRLRPTVASTAAAA